MTWTSLLLCLLASCTLLLVTAQVPKDYVATPHHPVHKDCVHYVPPGTVLHAAGSHYALHHQDGSVDQLPLCSDGLPGSRHGQAWKAWAQADNQTSLSYMAAEWPVPPSPGIAVGQILYFWPGTEPANNSFVLQPVLQWGRTPAGGGEFWALASWYVGDRAFYTDLIDAGDSTVSGSMKVNSAQDQWTIISENDSGETVTLLANTTVSQAYAYTVLEAYYLVLCDEYPKNFTNEVFTNIDVAGIDGETFNPDWEVFNDNPGSFTACKEHASINSESSTTISWVENKNN